MKKAALYVGIIAALICGTTFAAVISGTSVGSSAVYTTPVPAQYVAASYGSGLANESIAAGTDAVLYCAMDNLDGTTSTPECGLNAIRHKGVGPFSDANYFSSPGVNDIFDLPASGWTVTVVWQRALGDNQMLIGADQINVAGWYLRDRGTAGQIHLGFYPGGAAAVTAATAIGAAGTVHVATVGITATGEVKVKADGGVTQGALATGYVPATATLTAIGKAASFGGYPTLGNIMEIHVASDPFVEATVAARQASIMSCRTAGRCIPTTSDEVAYFGGSDYTIGGSWCGDYPTCSASKTFARQGVITTREARYSWPLLTPTQNGTVPRVATSGIYRQGYGARHASMGPFSNTNNFSLPAGNILGGGGDQTVCMIYKANSCASFYGLFGSSTVSTSGWQITQSSACTVYATVFIPSAGDIGTKVAAPNTTHVVCGGKAGSLWSLKLDDNAVESYALTMVTGNNTTLLGDHAGAVGLNGEIYEFFATTTPATPTYLTYLTDAAMRCTTQGNCFPRDANTVMHCNGDEFTGSVLRCGVNTGADAWTTNGTVTLNAPSFYQNVNAQRISASGAGPYSSANSFQWGTTTDVLDFPGSWTVCSSFDVTTSGGQIVNGGYDAGTQTGWTMTYVSGKLQCTVSTATGGAGTADTSANAGADGSLNLGCCGWDQNTDTIYAMLNASAVATATKKYAPALTLPSYIGRRNAAGTEHGGRVYEILALNKAPTTGQLEVLQRRWLSHQSLTGRALSNTHTIDTGKHHSAGNLVGRGVNTQRQTGPTLINSIYSGTPGTVGTIQTVPPGFIVTSATPSANRWLTTTSAGNTLFDATVTANAALAPDGTMTATTVREQAGKVSMEVYFDAGTSGTVYSTTPTASVYFRPVGPRNCVAYLFGSYRFGIGWSRLAQGFIDIAANKHTLGGFGGSINDITKVNSGHEYLKDGWIRLWVSTDTFNLAGDPYSFALRIQPGSVCTYVEFTTDPNYGYDIWKPVIIEDITSSVTEPITPVPYSCAPNATCTGETVTAPNPLRPNGTDWTNLILQSEDLATTWGVVNTAVLVNSTLSPDGSFTADKLHESNTTNAPHYAVQNYTATAAPWTASLDVKAGERSWIMMTIDGGASGYFFDVLNCSVGSAFISGTTGSTLQLPDGWCRVQVTKTMTAGPTSARVYLAVGDAAHVYVGDVGKGLYITNIQLETGSTPSPYCPTTTTARTCGPGGATGKTVTNLHFNSENVAAWSRVSNVTPSLVSVTGPLGSTVTANRITETNFNGTHYADNNPSVSALTNALTFTMKPDTRSWVRVYKAGGAAPSCYFNLATPAVGTCAGGAVGAIEAIGNGWVRGQVILASDAGSRFFGFDLATADNTNSYAGDGTSGLWLLNFQREEMVTGGGFYCGPTAAASRTCAPTQRWCVRVKDATPGYGRPWASTLRALWSIGDIYGGVEADAAGVYVNGTVLNFDVVGLSGTPTCAVVHSLTSGTHTVTTCVLDGVRTIYIDDVLKRTCSATGPVARFRTPVTLGNNGAGSYAAWDGTIGSIDFNTTGDPKDFPSDRRTP